MIKRRKKLVQVTEGKLTNCACHAIILHIYLYHIYPIYSLLMHEVVIHFLPDDKQGILVTYLPSSNFQDADFCCFLLSFVSYYHLIYQVVPALSPVLSMPPGAAVNVYITQITCIALAVRCVVTWFTCVTLVVTSMLLGLPVSPG